MAVLVLNSTYEPLHTVSIPHAVRMLVRQVAVVEEAHESHTIGAFPLPKILRLVRYITFRLRRGIPPWSRRGVLKRDGHTCGYCGKTANSVDHVVPRSKGGPNTWLNTVAACTSGRRGGCNGRKGNRTPDEAGMRLLRVPFEPRLVDLI